MTLSILTDFCSWWPLWWILPFLLGILLGRVLWGSYKSKYTQMENSLNRHKSLLSDLENELSKCNKNGEALERKLQDLKKTTSSFRAPSSAVKSSFKEPEVKSNVDAIVPPVAPTPKAEPEKSLPVSDNTYGFLENHNLQIIEGIGPKMEKLLHENGITSWTILSRKSKGELKAILDKSGNKHKIIDSSDWPRQAGMARAKSWDDLIAYQKKDGSASKLEKFIKKNK